jgi:hypothetical protein
MLSRIWIHQRSLVHYDGAGPCVYTASTPHLGFHCRQLRLKIRACGFRVMSSHLLYSPLPSTALYCTGLRADCSRIHSLTNWVSDLITWQLPYWLPAVTNWILPTRSFALHYTELDWAHARALHFLLQACHSPTTFQWVLGRIQHVASAKQFLEQFKWQERYMLTRWHNPPAMSSPDSRNNHPPRYGIISHNITICPLYLFNNIFLMNHISWFIALLLRSS